MIEINLPPETRIYLAKQLEGMAVDEPRYSALSERLSGDTKIRYRGFIPADEAVLLRTATLRAIREWKSRRFETSAKDYQSPFFGSPGVLRALSHLARALRDVKSA